MSRKSELIEQARNLGVDLDSRETVADLEAKIAAATDRAEPVPDMAEAQVKRHRVNRGSRRRIERAAAALNAALDEAIKSFDVLAYQVDAAGNRSGEWPAVSMLREAKKRANDMVGQLLAG